MSIGDAEVGNEICPCDILHSEQWNHNQVAEPGGLQYLLRASQSDELQVLAVSLCDHINPEPEELDRSP